MCIMCLLIILYHSRTYLILPPTISITSYILTLSYTNINSSNFWLVCTLVLHISNSRKSFLFECFLSWEIWIGFHFFWNFNKFGGGHPPIVFPLPCCFFFSYQWSTSPLGTHWLIHLPLQINAMLQCSHVNASILRHCSLCIHQETWKSSKLLSPLSPMWKCVFVHINVAETAAEPKLSTYV